MSESYKAVCEQVDEVSMKGYLPACWVAIIKVCLLLLNIITEITHKGQKYFAKDKKLVYNGASHGLQC